MIFNHRVVSLGSEAVQALEGFISVRLSEDQWMRPRHGSKLYSDLGYTISELTSPIVAYLLEWSCCTLPSFESVVQSITKARKPDDES